LPRVESIPTGPNSVSSEDLSDWDFAKDMHRGAKVVRTYVRVGETAALDRLSQFIEEKIFRYNDLRDFPNLDATSGLSQNLTVGEISPRTCWFAAQRAFEQGQDQAEIFMKELVWREFAYHLMHHTPHITSQNWKPDWDNFPWNTDETHPNVVAWTQGRTGIQFVDAAMRELYVTGTMHNRARMIVASYLTKHLLTHWQIGQKWFEDTLLDWDPASNAMGWQWSAGSGPDATPYFRVFNPVTQLDKFDKNREYVSRWIAEGKASPTADSRAFFKAIPESWRLSEKQLYPHPKVTAEAGRKIALSAYENKGF
jgi:deoxyribodipyrimidine photo-lyase